MTADERGPFALRYVPGTDLARRFPGKSQGFASREEAEAVRRACFNVNDMDVVTTCAYEVSARTWDDPAVYCERDAEPGSRYCAIHQEEM